MQKIIDAINREKAMLLDKNRAVKESFDIIEQKLHQTENLLDQRVQKIDEQDLKLKEVYQRVDLLEVENSD